MVENPLKVISEILLYHEQNSEGALGPQRRNSVFALHGVGHCLSTDLW
jgi:hypothetical protein